jgi:minor extracellular serine protease Vpr
MAVVNLSLGGTQRGPNDFLDMVLNATVDAGVVAAVSAGNEGPGPVTIGSPGTAANAITVGAVTNTHLVGAFVEVTGLDPFPGAAGDYDPFEDQPALGEQLSDWGGRACTAADATTGARVAGTVTLIDRGDCTFTTKIRHAQQAGAFGVLIVNNVEGPATGPGADGSQPDPTIPALGISLADGTAVREVRADDPSVTVTITGEQQEVEAEGDVLAGFSSRGPTSFTRALKPEIVAPGVNIVSSVFDGGWAAFQGTSMAAPHVAGAAALLLDDDPGLSPAQVKSALVNRAKDLGYRVLEQGAGRLDVAAAYDASVFAEPAAISFAHRKGNTNQAIPAVTVSLSGTGSSDCTATAAAPAQVSSIQDGTFTVSLPAPRSLAVGDNSGIVTVTCGEGEELRIPWYARVDRNR